MQYAVYVINTLFYILPLSSPSPPSFLSISSPHPFSPSLLSSPTYSRPLHLLPSIPASPFLLSLLPFSHNTTHSLYVLDTICPHPAMAALNTSEKIDSSTASCHHVPLAFTLTHVAMKAYTLSVCPNSVLYQPSMYIGSRSPIMTHPPNVTLVSYSKIHTH